MLVDMCRKGWALRCLREAKDEIKIAQKDSRAIGLIFDALRKAEIAVYYCLGEPSLIESIIEEFIESGLTPKDSILRYLVELKKTVRNLESALRENLRRNRVSFRELENMISAASRVVDLIASIGVED